MKNLNWPTAVVCAVFVLVVGALLYSGKPVPAGWLGIAGTIIAGSMQALFGGSSSGGGTLTSLPGVASKSNGPVPPAASRVGLLGVVFACVGCVNGQPTPQTVQDVTIGLNAAMCVLTTYATDTQAGKSEGDAIADAAIKCGVSLVQATGVLDAHKKAETLEAKK